MAATAINRIATAAFAALPSVARFEQTFPTLTPNEIDRLRAFGTIRRYADGQYLVESGKTSLGMFVVLSGHVPITQRDGLGHVTPIVDYGPGQFLAEIGQLSGRQSLVDGKAEGDVEALLIPPAGLRRLIISEAELGERITRALILRRVSLIQSAASGPVLIGSSNSADVVRLQGFLTSNGYPHHLIDPASDAEAASLIVRYAPTAKDLPLVISADGLILRNPSETALARVIGMIGGPNRQEIYDLAIVGCGPAGLSTAVYAASEGLSVIVFDTRAFGGQAGASPRIENYFGFPTGISGQALAGRAFVQAQKFGAEIMIPREVKSLDCSRVDGSLVLKIDGGGRIHARSVVIASGAHYRRPAIKDLQTFEGRGVWYWASPIEAQLCAGHEVILVGGGNSAGEAAVFLSRYAKKIRMMVRGKGLAESMSRYLIDRIEASPNIELMIQTEVIALEGNSERGVERVRWRNRATGAETVGDIRNVFLFVGADPATSWLAGSGVEMDKNGFVITGAERSGNLVGSGSPLESSVPGVFAVGDVRSGSVKRVGSAIGEGAQVVQALHRYLSPDRLGSVQSIQSRFSATARG